MSFGAVICQNWNATKLAWPGSKKLLPTSVLHPSPRKSLAEEELRQKLKIEEGGKKRARPKRRKVRRSWKIKNGQSGKVCVGS